MLPKGMAKENNTFLGLDEDFSTVSGIKEVGKDEKTCLGAERRQREEQRLGGWIWPLDMRSFL